MLNAFCLVKNFAVLGAAWFSIIIAAFAMRIHLILVGSTVHTYIKERAIAMPSMFFRDAYFL
jgi:hypothetical protein